jgi:hypothetical protein
MCKPKPTSHPWDFVATSSWAAQIEVTWRRHRVIGRQAIAAVKYTLDEQING